MFTFLALLIQTALDAHSNQISICSKMTGKKVLKNNLLPVSPALGRVLLGTEPNINNIVKWGDNSTVASAL